MKLFLTVALLFSAGLTTFAQQTDIRWNETEQITWSDFLGHVNDTSKFDAECFAEIRYNYKFYGPSDFKFDVYANFNKNTSWSRREKQSPELLRHEQMHFNIAELFAEKLKKRFNSYSYSASYSSEIVDVFNEVKQQYHDMQLQYDAETNHSLNKEKQKAWEDYIDTELRKTRLSLQLAQTSKNDKEKDNK